jgi:pimeloyl-ACP methyl ester carboxylesterase
VNKQRLELKLGEMNLAYSLYSKSTTQNSSPRRMVMLHGAGVAGELTWTFISNYLQHWDEILIPDLLGMGGSYFDADDHESFTIEDICSSILSLLRHHQWQTFDLVGYSLGGLVALELNHQSCIELDSNSKTDYRVDHLCLIEPALFSDQSLQAAIVFRQAFTPIAANIRTEPDNSDHFIDFLDLVSPGRKSNSKMDLLAVQRLQARPFGFANALASVSKYAEALTEQKLHQLIAAIPKGLGIVGGLSNPGLLLAQEKIKNHQALWQIEVLPNTDHSLVYVRPKVVAQLINQYLG